MVCIVVSIVILAGVVIYFVKGTKMLPKRNKATNAGIPFKRKRV